jgi:mannose-6-phosphate isomerase-like protein (cupin superfamily)
MPRTFTWRGYGAARTVPLPSGPVDIVDLLSLEGRGPAWGTASDDLNATLLVWREGEGQPTHVNEERDVALVVLAGAGTLVVDGQEHRLSEGTLAIVPRGATRSLVAGPDGLRCVSLHRRRGGLSIAAAPREERVSD